MSAETLRQAAEKIRADWSGMRGAAWKREGAFHLAVANWLDAEKRIEVFGSDDPTRRHALTIARAYLGSES